MDEGPGPVLVTVDLAERHQTIEGFGASIAWFWNYAVDHPNKVEIYDQMFSELGINILRLRNTYGRDEHDFVGAVQEIVEEGRLRTPQGLRLLLTSWSPPAALKASGRERCTDDTETCTLALEAGEFVYEAFADYWLDSIADYSALGMAPYYISLQNEPDFTPPDWEGCRFHETERDGFPGYDQALDAVAERLGTLGEPPLLLGPDVANLQNEKVERYSDAIDLSKVHGLCHHLYHGYNPLEPDRYVGQMRGLASRFPDIPLFQTEFAENTATAVETAGVIHNALVEEKVSAYLYWDLIWQGAGLVEAENPYEPDNWQTEAGYRLSPHYYAIRHYSRFIAPGAIRVAVSSSENRVRASGYESPEGAQLTLVVVNRANLPFLLRFDLGEHPAQNVELYLTTPDTPWLESKLGEEQEFSLPASSILTLVASR